MLFESHSLWMNIVPWDSPTSISKRKNNSSASWFMQNYYLSQELFICKGMSNVSTIFEMESDPLHASVKWKYHPHLSTRLTDMILCYIFSLYHHKDFVLTGMFLGKHTYLFCNSLTRWFLNSDIRNCVGKAINIH